MSMNEASFGPARARLVKIVDTLFVALLASMLVLGSALMPASRF